ncbi:hypothetical protein EVAR_6530_1 [Eumeta japonica]|uniref:Mariner Mos1 transposase n=1 Tax=Eumeta variegata TaxID=151549 RepID=A0A4C1SQA9_EUMVA|nr:hypothetical protein EVAR_6530_1 [Eumeta japonica]
MWIEIRSGEADSRVSEAIHKLRHTEGGGEQNVTMRDKEQVKSFVTSTQKYENEKSAIVQLLVWRKRRENAGTSRASWGRPRPAREDDRSNGRTTPGDWLITVIVMIVYSDGLPCRHHRTKLFSRWVLYNFSEEQKAARVNWCWFTLQRSNGGTSKAVYNIVSGNKSCINSYKPGKKHQLTIWIFEDELKPTKVTRSRRVSKKLVVWFVSRKGDVATNPLQEHRTVTIDWYTMVCLSEMIPELFTANSKRRIILHRDKLRELQHRS